MGQSLFLTAILLINQLELLVIMITVDKSIVVHDDLLRSHQPPWYCRRSD